ncbi:MAG: site-specific integrase [Parashewanella sp.]
MKIYLEKRNVRADGTRAIRLVYDSSNTNQRKRQYEPLNLFVYDKPKTTLQRQHNKEHEKLAELIMSKRLVEAQSKKHGFEDKTKLTASFMDYFQSLSDIKRETTTSSNHSIWVSTKNHLQAYIKNGDIAFQDITKEWLEGFKTHLEKTAKTKSNTLLSRNTQSTYFNKVRATLNQAQQDGIIQFNPVIQVRSIKGKTSQRVYLTLEEVNALTQTECRYSILKQAFLFSCSTGLRWSDIQKLTWKEVEQFNNHKRIVFHQKKLERGDAKSLLYLDLSPSAEKLLSEPQEPNERVFKGLKYSSYVNVELLRWALAAGINKRVTFHSGRHTFAVIQLSRGVEIYAVSRLLGHSELRTTEIYADIIEKRRVDAMLTFPDIFSLKESQ